MQKFSVFMNVFFRVVFVAFFVVVGFSDGKAAVCSMSAFDQLKVDVCRGDLKTIENGKCYYGNDLSEKNLYELCDLLCADNPYQVCVWWPYLISWRLFDLLNLLRNQEVFQDKETAGRIFDKIVMLLDGFRDKSLREGKDKVFMEDIWGFFYNLLNRCFCCPVLMEGLSHMSSQSMDRFACCLIGKGFHRLLGPGGEVCFPNPSDNDKKGENLKRFFECFGNRLTQEFIMNFFDLIYAFFVMPMCKAHEKAAVHPPRFTALFELCPLVICYCNDEPIKQLYNSMRSKRDVSKDAHGNERYAVSIDSIIGFLFIYFVCSQDLKSLKVLLDDIGCKIPKIFVDQALSIIRYLKVEITKYTCNQSVRFLYSSKAGRQKVEEFLQNKFGERKKDSKDSESVADASTEWELVNITKPSSEEEGLEEEKSEEEEDKTDDDFVSVAEGFELVGKKNRYVLPDAELSEFDMDFYDKVASKFSSYNVEIPGLPHKCFTFSICS